MKRLLKKMLGEAEIEALETEVMYLQQCEEEWGDWEYDYKDYTQSSWAEEARLAEAEVQRLKAERDAVKARLKKMEKSR